MAEARRRGGNPQSSDVSEEDRATLEGFEEREIELTGDNHFEAELEKSIRTGEDLTGLRVAIDVGHGAHPYGFEVGTRGNGYTEFDLNIVMSSEISGRLAERGAQVDVYQYDRSGPFLRLPERGQRAQKHDIFVSCHHNGHNTRTQGTETLIDVDSTSKDMELAYSIQKEVYKAIKSRLPHHEDRGVKWQDLGVLGSVPASVEAACLVEPYFIDDKNEAAREHVGPGLSRVAAKGVADGIRKYWLRRQVGKRSYRVQVPFTGEEDFAKLKESVKGAWCIRHKGYEAEGCQNIQAGLYNDVDSAREVAKKLQQKGYKAAIRESVPRGSA